MCSEPPLDPVIHEVAVNRPQTLRTNYKNIDDLVTLKEETCYDYRLRSCHHELYRDTDRQIRDYPYERLKRGYEMKDAPLLIEHALR